MPSGGAGSDRGALRTSGLGGAGPGESRPNGGGVGESRGAAAGPEPESGSCEAAGAAGGTDRRETGAAAIM